jgi:guanylate kinase
VSTSLYIISSVAGGGKSTLISKLVDRHKDLKFSVSYTSRYIRNGEIDGKSYHFVSKEKFQKLIQENYFLEWAVVHDNYYGTPKEFILENIRIGNKILLDIDIQGCYSIKSRMPDAKSIFILPPSEEIWIERLRKRGTDSPESIEKRISNGKKELLESNKFDYNIINDNLDKAYEELEKIIYSE